MLKLSGQPQWLPIRQACLSQTEGHAAIFSARWEAFSPGVPDLLAKTEPPEWPEIRRTEQFQMTHSTEHIPALTGCV